MAGESPSLMVRGFGGRVKPDGLTEEYATVTSVFASGRPSNIGQKTRVGGSACGVVKAGLSQTEGAIDGHAHVGRVFVFLAVILPPADRAQGERTGNGKGTAAATGATVSDVHIEWTEICGAGIT